MRYYLSQENFFTQKAKEEGYPARSVYKLQEIDRKFGIFQEGNAVLDLGGAPGSWLLYISKKVGPKGRVVGVDLEDFKIEMPANSVFLKKSVFDEQLRADIGVFNVVASDLAPGTTGLHEKDVADCLELTQRAFEIACQTLEAGGSFVCKIFQGADVDDFIKEVGKSFKTVKRYRPQAIRRGSREFYLIAKNFIHSGILTYSKCLL
ncbi:MAG: RlmE family RNA methyltransferase [Candidatus Gribaldobacteria bacterium]|nr:RlmE family RNA methyltransferase [Candidatus Gribaldobacteria bacterium]